MSWLRYFQNERNYIYKEIYGDVFNIKRVYKKELNIPLNDYNTYYYYNLLKNDTFYSLITTQGGSPYFRFYISKFDGENNTIRLLDTYSWLFTSYPRMLITSDNIYAFYQRSYYIISFDLESVNRVDVNSGYQNFSFISVNPIKKGDYIYMWGYAYSSNQSAYQLYRIQGSNYIRVNLDPAIYTVYSYSTFGISNNQLYFSIYYRPGSRGKLIRINEQDLSFQLLRDIISLYYVIDDDDNFYVMDYNSTYLTKLDSDLNQVWQNNQINHYHTFVSRIENGNLVYQAPSPNYNAKLIDKDDGSIILNSTRLIYPKYVLENDICTIAYTIVDGQQKLLYRRVDKDDDIKYEKIFSYSDNPLWKVASVYQESNTPPLNLFVNSKAMNVWYTYYYDNGYKLKFEAYQANVTSKSSNFFFFLRRHEE